MENKTNCQWVHSCTEPDRQRVNNNQWLQSILFASSGVRLLAQNWCSPYGRKPGFGPCVAHWQYPSPYIWDIHITPPILGEVNTRLMITTITKTNNDIKWCQLLIRVVWGQWPHRHSTQSPIVQLPPERSQRQGDNRESGWWYQSPHSEARVMEGRRLVHGGGHVKPS